MRKRKCAIKKITTKESLSKNQTFFLHYLLLFVLIILGFILFYKKMKKIGSGLLFGLLVVLCGCNLNNTKQDLKFEFEMKEKCSKYDTEELRENLSESIEGISMYNIFYSEKYNSCLAYYNGSSDFEGLYETAGVSMAPFDIITDIFSKEQLFKCGYHWVSEKPYDSKTIDLTKYLNNKRDHQELFLYYDDSFYKSTNTFDNDCKLIADDFISNIK